MPDTDFSVSKFFESIEGVAGNVPVIPLKNRTEEQGKSSAIPNFDESYSGSIDYRLRQISYSSLLTLHECPRKFQLSRLKASDRADISIKSQITFAYGHAVGTGVQELISGLPLEDVIWNLFLSWPLDISLEDEKSDKSIWTAIFALQRFVSITGAGFLQDYELVYYEGKPACELSFAIVFPDGFRYRGFVDAVLRHKQTGKILVLELKTTGMATLKPSTYKNSAQAVGYSVILDVIFPGLSSYSVLYLVYQTKAKEFTPLEFPKSFLQRALWIRELLLDIETIKMYEEAEVYPMRGESCMSFGADCVFLNTCTLDTSRLAKPITLEDEDKTDYQIVLSLEDLLDSQLSRTEELNDD